MAHIKGNDALKLLDDLQTKYVEMKKTVSNFNEVVGDYHDTITDNITSITDELLEEITENINHIGDHISKFVSERSTGVELVIDIEETIGEELRKI